jgi:hypothetical protein
MIRNLRTQIDYDEQKSEKGIEMGLKDKIKSKRRRVNQDEASFRTIDLLTRHPFACVSAEYEASTKIG